MKKKNIKTFRKGDILLIKHKLDPIGWLIRIFTKSKFNHVCWILNKNKIIESGRYGVAIHSINKYFNKFLYYFELVRIKKINNIKLDKAITIAILSTKKGNYFKQLLTFILLYFKYEGILPKSTCSGLIAQSLNTIGFKFNDKNPSRITPEDIYRSKNVRKIKINN